LKKEIKKVIYLLNPAMLIMLASQTMAAANNAVPDVNLNVNSVYQLFVNAMNWVFSFAIVLAIILMIFGGISYMTAGGDETKLGTAKKRIIWGLVGAAIVIAAWGLINLIAQYLNANVVKPQ
jgi:hypothetical protein